VNLTFRELYFPKSNAADRDFKLTSKSEARVEEGNGLPHTSSRQVVMNLCRPALPGAFGHQFGTGAIVRDCV